MAVAIRLKLTRMVNDKGIQRYDHDGKKFIHLLNYRYDEKEDRVMPIPELCLKIRQVCDSSPVLHTPEGTVAPDIAGISHSNGWVKITLRNTGLYTIIEFRS